MVIVVVKEEVSKMWWFILKNNSNALKLELIWVVSLYGVSKLKLSSVTVFYRVYLEMIILVVRLKVSTTR